MSESCSHAGFHSGVGRYAADERRMRFVVVCDNCGAELREVTAVEYEPQPANDPAPVAARAG